MLANDLLPLAALFSLATSSAIPAELSGPIHGDIFPSAPTLSSSNVLEGRIPYVVIDIYSGCGIGLNTVYTNNAVNGISSRDSINLGAWEGLLIPKGMSSHLSALWRHWICVPGGDFKIYVQQQVSPVCGSFIAST